MVLTVSEYSDVVCHLIGLDIAEDWLDVANNTIANVDANTEVVDCLVFECIGAAPSANPADRLELVGTRAIVIERLPGTNQPLRVVIDFYEGRIRDVVWAHEEV